MKRKRLISLALVAILVLLTTTGWAGTKQAAVPSTYVSKEKITIKYWVPFAANQYIKSLNESEMYKELERRTNVHVEFIHPTEGQETEQFNLMINSKELPDVIVSYAGEYKGGMDKAISDGAYLRLNELINKYAPNFKKLRQSDAELARQTITDEGNIYAFPVIGQDKNEPAWWGPVIRKDLLTKLKLKEPTTIPEWHNVLSKFKNVLHVQAPLSLRKTGVDPYGTLVSAFDIGNSFFRKNNVVKYGPMEPQFKEYLKTMHAWYKEGLIDKDFATRDRKSREAMITSGKIGAFITEYALVDQYAAAIKTTNPKAEFAPTVQPALKPGQKVNYRVVNNRNGGYEAVITTSCKYPEAVVKWFDYAYGKEGFMLFNYGIEGKSYTMVNGKPKFTPLLTKNPDGLDFWTVCNKFKLDVGPYLRDYKALPEFTKIDLACMDKWTKAGDSYVIPPTNMTPEESEVYSNVMGDVDTYKDEMILKFIMGKEPIANFDKYVAQLKKMGITDVVKIQQAALDRYNKRKVK